MPVSPAAALAAVWNPMVRKLRATTGAPQRLTIFVARATRGEARNAAILPRLAALRAARPSAYVEPARNQITR